MFRVKTSGRAFFFSIDSIKSYLSGFGVKVGFFILNLKPHNYFNFEARRGGFKIVLFLLLLVGVFADCRSEKPAVSDRSAAREMTDDLGRRVIVPQKIERAISLAPSLTESIFAVGAGDRLVGVTTFCDYPPEAEKIPKVSDTLTPNLEAIIALRPQIIFVSTASQLENFFNTLEKQNIAVFVTAPNNLDDVFKNLLTFGELFGTKPQAEKLVGELKSRVAAVSEKVKDKTPVKVFTQIDKDPLYTIGKDSFITDLITRAGGESVTKDLPTPYPKISRETALASNPDAIILSESANNLAPNEVFKNSNAVKNGKVFKISADMISRPGPRLVDGLEQIAKDLHP